MIAHRDLQVVTAVRNVAAARVSWRPADCTDTRDREVEMADREQFYEVFSGIDVGKENHDACALNSGGRRVHDKIQDPGHTTRVQYGWCSPSSRRTGECSS